MFSAFDRESFELIQIWRIFKMISFLFFVSAVGHLEKYTDENIKLHEKTYYWNTEMELFFNIKGE